MADYSSFPSVNDIGDVINNAVEDVGLLDLDAQISQHAQGSTTTVFGNGAAWSRYGNEKAVAFTNSGSNKGDLYFSAPTDGVTFNDLRGIYYTGGNNGTRMPFVVVYTKPLGDGSDKGLWYRDRFVFTAPSSPPKGEAIYHAGEYPSVEYGLLGVALTAQPLDPAFANSDAHDAAILTIALSTDSAETTAGAYNFYIEKAGHSTKNEQRAQLEFSSATTAGATEYENFVSLTARWKQMHQARLSGALHAALELHTRTTFSLATTLARLRIIQCMM